MDIVLLDDVVYTDYGQLDLVWDHGPGFDGQPDKYFNGQVNGLVGGAHPAGVYLNLARRSGGSRVRIVLLDAAPPAPPLQPDAYADVVEVSTTVPSGADPRWASWAGETGGLLAGLAPGSYRLRVSAKGRDAAGGDGEFAEGIVDEYLLELWPAAAAPDEILSTGSENARYWHREWGGRR